MISTNGSSLPCSASYQAWMYSWPTSYASTWLWIDDARHPGDDAVDDVLEARVRRRRHRDRVALAREARRHPEDVRGDLPPSACWFGYELGRRHRSLPLLAQQIRGSGSPTSWSITRLPPNAVSTSTIPGGSVLHLADHAPPARRPARPAARRAPRRRRSAATKATSLPSLATYIGSMPEDLRGAGHRRRRPARPPRAPRIATPEARASSFSTDATPPRVASRMQCSAVPGGVEQRVDGRPQRARVRLDRRRRARTRRGPA